MKQSLHPWFEQAWSELNLTNMPHAILLHGQTGIGKMDFALHLAKALICETSQATKPAVSVKLVIGLIQAITLTFWGLFQRAKPIYCPMKRWQGTMVWMKSPKKAGKR